MSLVLSQGIILVSDQDKDSEKTKSSILFQGCYKMSDFLLKAFPAKEVPFRLISLVMVKTNIFPWSVIPECSVDRAYFWCICS